MAKAGKPNGRTRNGGGSARPLGSPGGPSLETSAETPRAALTRLSGRPAEPVMVFCYDVSDNRRRRKVAAILEEEAVRVQQSVFEARMPRRLAERLTWRLRAVMAPDDSLRVYAVGAHSLRASRTYGGPPLPEAQDFWLL